MPRCLWPLLVAAMLVLAGCSKATSNKPLESFVDQDLRKLDKPTKVELRARLAKALPERFLGDTAGAMVPWHLWCHRLADGSPSFILFEGWSIFETPSEYPVVVHFMTPDGQLLGSTEFSIGWRVMLDAVSLRHDPAIGCTIIDAQTSPDIRGPDIRHEFYGVIGNRVGLLRIEAADRNIAVELLDILLGFAIGVNRRRAVDLQRSLGREALPEEQWVVDLRAGLLAEVPRFRRLADSRDTEVSDFAGRVLAELGGGTDAEQGASAEGGGM